ncbi:MAG TPA: hypothetical protein VM871_07985 [Flavisolibacter sp.]|nr:hypothetical protein [Flavisolibacter sp.]
MKTRNLFIAAFIVATTVSWIHPPAFPDTKSTLACKADLSTAFAFLRTHRQGSGITATWALTATAGVTGFAVQRTDEDPFDPFATWQNVGSVPVTGERSFSYHDEQVLPGMIHYRIVALMNDGSTVMSEISGVRIVSRK